MKDCGDSGEKVVTMKEASLRLQKNEEIFKAINDFNIVCIDKEGDTTIRLEELLKEHTKLLGRFKTLLTLKDFNQINNEQIIYKHQQIKAKYQLLWDNFVIKWQPTKNI